MKIGIIGAGPGGLAAADLLAGYGYNVTLFEKEAKVGGRNGAIETENYTFDIGPTFFMMDFILREIFEECGGDLEDYVDLIPLDPYYQLIYGDGGKIRMGPDRERVKDSLRNFNEKDARGYDTFLNDNETKLNRAIPALQRGYDTYLDMLSSEVMHMLPVTRPFTSLWDDLGKHFENDKVKIGFTFQSKYLGMSPYNCPSMFSILSYIEHKWGIHHVKGGLNKLSSAMAKLFSEMGGELALNTEVDEIIIENNKARGVLLENGDKEYFDEIVIGSDFAWSMKNLIPNKKRSKYSNRKLDGKKYSCSTYMLYLGLDKLYDGLEHHNVFISEDYKSNFEEIETEKVLSEDPSFYLQNPSVTDTTLAPEGGSTLYVLVPVPNLKGDIDWQKERNRFRNLVIDSLKTKASLNDLEDHIRFEKEITPEDWKDDLHVGYGATFNLAHNLLQLLAFRPRNRFEKFDNMWLVGGGTNPGSGLPTIYESGRISAHKIIQKHGGRVK